MDFYIISCPKCSTKYRVDPLKVKPGVKVRCKKCENIFILPSREEPEKYSAPLKTPEPQKPITTQKIPDKTIEAPRIPYELPLTPEQKREYDKAKRLARILAKDIINYYREKWERALREGRIKEILSDEINKSYKYYCEKVPEEIRRKTKFFEQAFNEIVGKGQNIFS